MTGKNGETKNQGMLDVSNSQTDARENKKRLTIEMPTHLHRKLKVAAAKRGETMAEIICNMVEKSTEDE